MELVQEVYEKLKEEKLDWPEYAVVAVKDDDGEIKFSSVGKWDIPLSFTGIYMRGSYCLFNTGLVPNVRLGFGGANNPSIVTRSEFEEYYFTKVSG